MNCIERFPNSPFRTMPVWAPTVVRAEGQARESERSGLQTGITTCAGSSVYAAGVNTTTFAGLPGGNCSGPGVCAVCRRSRNHGAGQQAAVCPGLTQKAGVAVERIKNAGRVSRCLMTLPLPTVPFFASGRSSSTAPVRRTRPICSGTGPGTMRLPNSKLATTLW